MEIQSNRQRRREILFFIFLFLFSTALTLKVHHGRGEFNWQCETWADRGGYYIYLPATFFYHFDMDKTPKDIDAKTGYGFIVDRNQKTIFTQYFYGEALLISPFFAAGHILSKVLGRDELGGFSGIFNKMFDIAAVFYLVLGLFFLKRFLGNYFKEHIQYILILLTFLGTNLFFYSMEDSLMSHVYSFFAVALFLFSMKEFLLDQTRYRYFLLMSFAYALMFIIRPTNCLIGIVFPFLDAGGLKEIAGRIKLILSPRYLLPLLAIMFVFFIPQMVYWKITHGTFIYLKYGAGFANWSHPKFLEVWFATLNGLIPWSPLIILFVAGMVFMIVRKIRNGYLILFIFLLVSYMAAAYKFWYYGCGYGHRAFVEFYPLLCIPLGFLMAWFFNLPGRALKIVFSIIVLFTVYLNVGLSLTADKCYFGSTWDWNQYTKMLQRIHLYPASARQNVFNNDFENEALQEGTKVSDSVANSGMWSAMLNPDQEFCCEHTARVWDFNGKYPEFVTVQILVKKVNPDPVNAVLVCSFEKNDTVLNWQSQELNSYVKNTLSWFTVQKTFNVPGGLSGDTRIKVYVWNRSKESFFVDDLKIRYE
jgi:hypothetical protein